MWRLAAWMTSALVYGAHTWYEQFRRANSPLTTAWHAALAVAIGAFGLAVAANIHEVAVSVRYRPALAVALVAWPIVTGVPAFLVALITAYCLALIARRIPSDAKAEQSKNEQRLIM